MTIDFNVIVPQKTPDVQVETDWTGGLTGLADSVKKTLLVGHPTGAATVDVHTPTPIYSRQDAINKFGKGSDIAVMADVFLKNSPRTPLYGMSYAVGTGSATYDVVISGTISGAGVLKVWVAGELFQVGIASGDTVTAIGDALEAEINAHPNLPVIASNAAGTVTLTARCTGQQGNSICVYAEITAAGGSVTPTASTNFAGGTAYGDPGTALAAIANDRYHLIVLNTDDPGVSGSYVDLITHLETYSQPPYRGWGIGIVGCNGTASTAQTLAGVDDGYRTQVAWLSDAEVPCFQIAAAFAGQRAKKAANKSLNNVLVSGLVVPFTETNWPSQAEIEASIVAGVTPLKPEKNGDIKVVRSVITRSTTPNFRDHMIAEISDYTDQNLIERFEARAVGKILKSGSPPGSPDVMTPQRLMALMNEVLFELDRADYIRGVQDAIDAGYHNAEINAEDENRVDLAFRFWPVATVHFVAIKKTYVRRA